VSAATDVSGRVVPSTSTRSRSILLPSDSGSRRANTSSAGSSEAYSRAWGRSPARAGGRATRAISALYLVGGIVGSVVAVRGDYPGLPLGIDLGLTSATGVWIGWGSGVSAPWPLLVALALTGVAGQGHRRTVPVLGLMFVSGALVEPIFWEANTGAKGAAIATLVWLNVVLPAMLIVLGARDWRRSGSSGHPTAQRDRNVLGTDRL
jgi:hypothetical protein